MRRRYFLSIAATALAFLAFIKISGTPYDPGIGDEIMGDLDGDGQVTLDDVQIAMDIAVGKLQPTPYQKLVGDINGDGRINSADVALIRSMVQ